MSTLFTTTSSSRPSDASTGDMYFETDTGRIIVYGGSGWTQYSPAGTGESVDDSGEINITYGTFDEILAIQDKSPGDLFFRKTDNYVFELTFTHVPGTTPGTAANGTIINFQIMDEDDVFTITNTQPRLTANVAGQNYYWDMDQANWGTSSWQGSQNYVDKLTELSALPAGATAVVSGDNNEVITFTSPTWMYIYSNYHYLKHPVAPDYQNVEDDILIYTGLDENDNELYSMITNY